MHLSRLLDTGAFGFSVAGATAGFDDVLPGFARNERVAIVCRTPGASHRAAGLLLAAVGRFYEIRRRESDDFYAYPDFYVIHAGRLHGYHGKIDVWPEHKEVVVAADPESVLSAINDRAVTRLLIEQAPPASGLFARETVAALRERLVTAYCFDPAGSPGADDVVVTPSEAAATAIRQSAESSRELVGDEAADRLVDAAAAPQGFRRLGADDVLSTLAGYGASDPDLRLSERYRRALGVGEATVDRHRYPWDPRPAR